MKNVKWIPPLVTMLFALPAFAQPLVLEDIASADMKAQIYENQMAETSGASAVTQTDNGAPAAEEAHASAAKAESASSAKEPEVAANEHASAITGHPEKPADKPEHKRVHFVKQAKKKTS